jgi:hypothetical protein
MPSVINLYDGSGDHHYQTKVSSDRVDIQANTIPLNLTGTSISLTNQGGDTINDIVGAITSILAQITQININISNLQVSDSVVGELLADIPITQPNATAIYTLSNHFGSGGYVIDVTNEDGSELSAAEINSLVNQNFTYDDLNNTAVIRFTRVQIGSGGLYVTPIMLGIPIGTKIIMLASSA